MKRLKEGERGKGKGILCNKVNSREEKIKMRIMRGPGLSFPTFLYIDVCFVYIIY